MQYNIFLKDSTLYKKIASNTIAQIISKALTAIISIFLIGILTKYLPQELYGSYNKVYSYLGIFAFLADLGLYTIAIREIAQGTTSKEKIIGNVLTLRALLWVAIWGIALLLALFLPGYHDSLTLLAIAIVGAFTLVSLINSSLLALMQSQMKMEFSVISLVAGKLLNLGMIAIFLMYIFTDSSSYAFISVFVAGLVGLLLNTGLNYFYANKIVPIRFRWDSDYIYHIFKISLPYGIALFLSVVYFKVDVILISLLESPQQADISIALYGLPMKIIEVLMVLGGFYLNSLLPSLTEKYTQKKHAEISDILGLSLKILLSFGLLLFLLGNIFAKEIIGIIATDEYITPTAHVYNSVQALQVVLWVLLFYFLSLNFIYMLIASQRQALLLWVNIFVTVVNILGNIYIIPIYSFLGSAYITLLSQVVLFVLTGYLVLREIPLARKYVLSLFWWIFWGICVFVMFREFQSYFTGQGDIKTLLLFAPLLSFIYLAGELFLAYILGVPQGLRSARPLK